MRGPLSTGTLFHAMLERCGGSDERPTSIARRLRRRQTSAERKLWQALRDRRLGGHKFTRQAAIEGFFVDFVCRESKLIVEIDGATHSTDAEVVRDRRRDLTLGRAGYRVVRVYNGDVYDSLTGVCDTILAALAEGHAPHPPFGHLLPLCEGRRDQDYGGGT